MKRRHFLVSLTTLAFSFLSKPFGGLLASQPKEEHPNSPEKTASDNVSFLGPRDPFVYIATYVTRTPVFDDCACKHIFTEVKVEMVRIGKPPAMPRAEPLGDKECLLVNIRPAVPELDAAGDVTYRQKATYLFEA